MNEYKQNKTIDDLIKKCPMFNNYRLKLHNIEIKRNTAYTLCELDNVYLFDDFILIGENKCRDSPACHKKMEAQMKTYRRYLTHIEKALNLSHKPAYYFYAHFENDKPHIIYKGFRD